MHLMHVLAVFWFWRAPEGPLKGPGGFPMVLNRQPMVPWEVEKMFYHGMISLWENLALLTWKVIGGMFWSFSGSEGHPRTPESSQLTTYCNIRCQDQISYNGTISLWENCVLLVWKVERGMSDDSRHVLAVFWIWGARPRVPNVSQLTT